MKKSKKYIIITNTYLALYKLCVSVLVILLLVISNQVTLSAQTNNSETEKNDTIPADKNRYIYLKKRLLLDFDIYYNLGNKFISGLSYRSSPMKMNIITYFSTIAGENYNNSLFIRKKT